MPHPDAAPGQPNIILITTDQQRYDSLGATGNPRVATPVLDRLAGQGVLFRRAYVQNPVCVPSRACIQTGRYVHQHGVEFMRSEIDQTPGLPPTETTLMEHLQRAGYTTAAFGKIHMMPPRGFDEMQLTMGKGARWTTANGSPHGPAQLGPVYADWLEDRSPGAYEAIYRERRRPEYSTQAMAVPAPVSPAEYVDGWIGQNAVSYVERHHEQPYFAWVGFCGPHTPFDPPAEYAHLVDPSTVPLPELFGASSPSPLVGKRHAAFGGPDGEANVRRVIAYYWAMMSLIDDMVGAIVAAVEQSPTDRDTMIIFTTDHGEMLGDFGTLDKANFCEQVIHVPLLVVPSLRDEPSAGRCVDALVEQVDLTATVLDVAGVPRPPEMSGHSLRGHWDTTATAHRRSSVLCEYTTNDRSHRSTCLRTDDHKYVFHDQSRPPELYDLHADPDELRNLALEPGHEKQLRRHAELLLDRITGGVLSAWNTTPAARWPADIDDFGRPRTNGHPTTGAPAPPHPIRQ